MTPIDVNVLFRLLPCQQAMKGTLGAFFASLTAS